MKTPPTLRLTPAERLARARSDMRMGVPVVLRGPGGAALVSGAEVLSKDRLAHLAAGGDAVLAITHRRAGTLHVPVYDGDLARLPLPRDVTPADLTAIADPAGDLDTPLKGPFRPVRGGDAALARAGLVLAKSARLLPAVVLVPVAEPPGDLTRLDADALTDDVATLRAVVSAQLPTSASRDTRLHVFRPDDGGDEHYAVEIGRPDRDGAPLVRLHSACFTGDVLHSLKCDCGPQLNGALAQMAGEGAGDPAVSESGRPGDRAGEQAARLCLAGSGIRHGRGEPSPGIRG
ncbi:GTP cyclohydrolase II domain protein [Oceaniovalibus guishaninsula JLT2003]|uniref:GTP cyclohydrolase II domain protein n=1 Tax=Oceaniovalibus guishaninsula JLT2003 TaxID=1231392 RepID=K2GNP3_9RHOB|nr:GTP cyclohydrolase II domain protein [Oceaniovalibus guishaninsula JLT2003]